MNDSDDYMPKSLLKCVNIKMDQKTEVIVWFAFTQIYINSKHDPVTKCQNLI